MSSALNSSNPLLSYEAQPVTKAAGSVFTHFASANAGAYETLKARIAESFPHDVTRRDYALLGLLALLLHGAAVLGYINRDTTTLLRAPHNEVEIELIKPVVVPPQEVEPPKPPPPRIVHQETPPPVQQPTPQLRTLPAEQNIAPDALTVPENTTAPKSSGPVVAAPPAPKVEEPVTEATANAAYLKNPPPDYPAYAQRQGWEGKVLLRVHVLANGKADKVEIKQSSGRKTLDDSALSSVKNWTFVPSKRGSTPIDGWATVPIEFKLAT